MTWNQGTHPSTRQWRTLRQQALTRDSHTCICGQPATEVDHIHNIAQHPQQANNLNNLQSLCHPCHTRKTNQEAQKARAERRSKLKRTPPRHPATGDTF